MIDQFRYSSKKEIWNTKHISSGTQTIVYGCFNVGLQNPSECRHGNVWPSSISLSNLSS